MTNVKKMTKGERTAQRLMDKAEQLFAERGFEGTTLRDVAAATGIREPGIYNHFANKDALYCAVLARGLQPMEDAIDLALAADGVGGASLKALSLLPGVMTDLLSKHPYMPALFQQALMSSANHSGHTVMLDWLDRLFARGERVMTVSGLGDLGEDIDYRRQKAIRLIAMFNLCSGYFLSQRVLEKMDVGSVLDQENLDQQKRMLGKIIRLFLVE